jgi:hypothetical protein
MPKQQPNGTPSKKPAVPSVKRWPVKSLPTMVEILKSRKPEQANEVSWIEDGTARMKLGKRPRR